MKEQPTPEELAKEAADIIFSHFIHDIIANGKSQHFSPQIKSGVSLRVENAIQTATEPLKREIETWKGNHDAALTLAESAGEIITQLESKYALLVEALNYGHEMAMEIRMSNHSFVAQQCAKNISIKCSEALTNTTQQAQARDKRLREGVIDDVLSLVSEEFNSYLGLAGAFPASEKDLIDAINQLKGGETQ